MHACSHYIWILRTRFRATEDDEIANVTIYKNQEFASTNPVTFRITPLIQFSRGIIDSYLTPDDENVSLSRAGELVSQIHVQLIIFANSDAADFNTTAFEVEFPSDANLGTFLADVDAPI